MKHKLVEFPNKLGYTLDAGPFHFWDIHKPEWTCTEYWEAGYYERSATQICGYGKLLKVGRGATMMQAIANAITVE